MQWLKVILFLGVILGCAFSQSANIQVPASTCNSSADLLTTISTIPRCVSEAIFNTIVEGFLYSAQQFYGLSMTLLTASPDINWFCQPYQNVMAIIETFYTIILMGLGAYYILHSTEVDGRVRSKIWLKNIFFMVVTLAFSFNLFGMLLDLNQSISTTIYSSVSSNIFDINAQLSNMIFALIVVSSFCMMNGLTFATLMARYMLIPFLLLIFPLAIFLYFIPFTRDWGAYLFKFIALVVFMTTIDAILLLGLSYLFNSPDPILSGTLKTFGLMIGFGLIGIVNLVIYLIAVISVISMALKTVESLASIAMKIAIMLSFL